MSDRDQFVLTTPVVLIIFNRPEKTSQVFAKIAEAKPTELFLVADGPRRNHPTDEANCAAARAVVENIDWECNIYRNYSESNLGCKHRVSSGLDWVFEQVEEAIILEDDILVDPSFFRFAQELLAYYRDDTRVVQIAGYSPITIPEDYPYSYFFSAWTLIWGWATWRRAWQNYDVNMSLWTPELRAGLEAHHYLHEGILRNFEQTHAGSIDTWDYQWLFASVIQSGLTVVPRQNMVQNIGFGPDATHTTHADSIHSTAISDSIVFPLLHPPYIMVDPVYNQRLMQRVLARPSFLGRAKDHLRSAYRAVRHLN